MNNSSLVIDTLCGQGDVDNMAVACAYCDFNSQEQSATGLFGALLKQVVSALEPVPDQVQRTFGGSKRGVGGRRLLLPDILEMLFGSLSCLGRVFICIDALDEFPAKHRPELWESLQKIVQKCPNTQLFLTGRLHIRDEVQKYFSSTADMLPISSRLVLFTSRLEPSPALGSSRLGAWHPWTRGSSLQETAKKPPRGSSLESSRLLDPCPSRLESPRGSSRLVNPCSSRQELSAKRLEPARARGTPGLEGLESARLVHNTILDRMILSYILR